LLHVKRQATLVNPQETVRAAFARHELVDSYAKLKLRQWDAYSAAISPWEREQTLDC
jgi:glutamine synthetase